VPVPFLHRFPLAIAFALACHAQPDLFESKIRPLLHARCSTCHGDKVQMAGKRFTTREGMHSSGAVVAGDPNASPLIQAVRYEGRAKMPPSGKLPAAEIAMLEKWIRDGAAWPETGPKSVETTAAHWALRPVRKPDPPAVRNTVWPRGDIDRFVLQRMESAGVAPVPNAGRHALLRRLTLDITGLLPAPAEIAEFTEDTSGDALEKAVDRLLASPAFGERWGRHWLDITYWADTTGVGRRIPLREAWRYRDYVIDSFNKDKPYDQFLREQITGSNGKDDAKVATGFLVLGPWAWFAYDKAQARSDIADLQVDLIGRSVMGLTLGCARCHDHKFDPITNKDYFALAGIFLSTKTTSRSNGEGGIHTVRLPETTASVQAHGAALAAWEKQVAELEASDKIYRQQQAELRKKIDALKAESKKDEAAAAEKALVELKKKTEFAGDRQILPFTKYMKPRWPEIYAAEEMEYPEDARIAARGDAHQLGEHVPRGFPAAIGIERPAIDPHSSGRTELAEWLTDPAHPLTVRVFVNRVWHHMFGRGIVATTDNFGSRGEPPTHPELLDYLAARFLENGWSAKKLIREIALSRVYQLSSQPDTSNVQVDAGNLWLWRSNRRRLEVEAIRDAILQTSGKLDRTGGGPSLPLTAQNVHTIAPFFLEDDSKIEPHIRYRRTVYQPILRNSQVEDVDILNVFDFKDPDQIAGTRPATTVPSQMLYLMNSAFVKEEARRLAEATGGLSAAARVERILLLALNRPATQRDQDQARQFLSDFGAKAGEIEAWARFCHAIFVSSEFLYRR